MYHVGRVVQGGDTELSRVAEIAEPDNAARADQDVAGLDIAVSHVARVAKGQATEDLPQHLARHGLGHIALQGETRINSPSALPTSLAPLTFKLSMSETSEEPASSSTRQRRSGSSSTSTSRTT
jgi:hypothetical protein